LIFLAKLLASFIIGSKSLYWRYSTGQSGLHASRVRQ